MFNFQHSQLTQNEFEQSADLLVKYPKVHATSKFDVGKINSPLHLSLKPDAVFKKQRASKVPIIKKKRKKETQLSNLLLF